MKKLLTIVVIAFILLGLNPSSRVSAANIEPQIQVKLLNYLGNRTSITLGVSGSYSLNRTTSLLSSKKYTLKIESVLKEDGTNIPVICIYDEDTKLASGESISLTSNNRNNQAILNDRGYLGNFKFSVESGKYISVINTIYLKDYVKCVVPSEMYASSWHKKALKAQAVAARTYAYFRLNKVIDDTTRYQAYEGTAKLHPNSTAATEETVGEIITYNGKVIDPLYSASNGGMTENNYNEFGSALLPYYPIQKDDYDTEQTWVKSIPKQLLDINPLDLGHPEKWWDNTNEINQDLSKNIKSWLSLNGYSNKELKIVSIPKLAFYEKTESGRVIKGDILFHFFVRDKVDTNGKLELQTKEVTNVIADNIRGIIGKSVIPSTLINNITENNETFAISGAGSGHGVGMSQHGANNRANAGMKYKDILFFYYPKTEISQQIYGPAKPVIKEITDVSTNVIGTTEANNLIFVKVGSTIIGRGTADATGGFNIVIPKQPAGTTVRVVVRDSGGHYSPYTTVSVTDVTAPLAPVVNSITEIDSVVEGTSESFSEVFVKVGTTIIGRGKADEKGQFSVAIPKQIADTKVRVVVRDRSGNYSSYTVVTVEN